MSDPKTLASSAGSVQNKMFTPSAIAIVNMANCPLLIRTSLDDVDKEEATKLIYLMHASLDIVEEKSEQPTSRDNFLGILYQCEQYKIYGLMSTTKVKILLMLSLKMSFGFVPRETDIRQMLKNIHRAYIDSTAMNPFYKPNEPVKSKRLDAFLETIFVQPAAVQAGEARRSPLPGSGVITGDHALVSGGKTSPVNPAVQTV